MTAQSVKFYTFNYSELRTYVFAMLFVVGNIVLPQLCHLIPQGGLTWLPIYFFTLVAAYKYGWKVGLLTAIASPIINNLLFAMSVSGNVSITGGKGNNLFLIETLSSGSVSGGGSVIRFDEPGDDAGKRGAVDAWNEAVSGMVAPGGGSLRFEDLHSTIYNRDGFSSIFSTAYWWNRG